MTINNQQAAVRKKLHFGQPLGDVVHGNQGRTVNPGEVMFEGLAAIEKDEGFANIQAALHIEDANFKVRHSTPRYNYQ